jgi:hypothetical protein
MKGLSCISHHRGGFRANGAKDISPGQRPGFQSRPRKAPRSGAGSRCYGTPTAARSVTNKNGIVSYRWAPPLQGGRHSTAYTQGVALG